MSKRKLRPVLDGAWWMIGPGSDLTGKLPGDSEHREAFEKGRIKEHNAPVDHHIVQSRDGAFHLWACVRNTSVGRVFYHWESSDVMSTPWQDSGEMIRADRDAGESIDDWWSQEWLQSPYFVQDQGTYYMFYGAHRAGVDEAGVKVGHYEPGNVADRSLYQICLMTSEDGRHWTRHRGADGTSRIFMGPGESRDPCVIKIDGVWHLYYAGYYDYDKPEEGSGFIVRTSRDLISWSDWRLVHQDPQYGVKRTDTECPYVVFRDGYFYLFRTINYYRCETLVFRSEDPYDFGIGDASEKLVGRLPCAAPELYTIGGVELLSSSHTPLFGEQMSRIRWIDDP